MRYISTCPGGNHHTFEDDKGNRFVLDTEQLRDQRITRDDTAAKYQSIEAVLPASVKTEVDKPKPEPVGDSEIKGAK